LAARRLRSKPLGDISDKVMARMGVEGGMLVMWAPGWPIGRRPSNDGQVF